MFAALLLAVLVIGGTRRQMIAALSPSWRESRAPGIPVGIWEYPLRFARDPMPETFSRFFERVERMVPAEAPIAVILPAPWDEEGPSYARFRIGYLLSGHKLVVVKPWTFKEAYDNAYVAAWRMAAPPSNGRVIYSGSEGILRSPNR